MYRRAEYQIITERMKEPRKFIQVVMGARQIGRRAEYQIITERMKEPRKFIQVVMGARQIGKSTVAKQVL